ncbi:DNA-directed RNA polymerase subunit omega, partial [Lacticaseibacillus rhamnosus MTCC 5462]
RAHELEAGDLKMLSDYKSDKSVGKALEEIAAGDVIIDPKSKMLERDAEKLDHKD